jgi:hypothetical protein
MRIVTSLLFVIFLFSACQDRVKVYDFYNDSRFTYDNGLPKNNRILYFPLNLYIDSFKYDKWMIEVDTFGDKFVSKILFDLGEPVLYINYINKEVFRLTLLRSFESNVVIRLERNKDSVRLISKSIYEHVSKPLRYLHDSPVIDSITIDSVTETKTLKFWNDFEALMNNNLHSMPSTVAMDFGPDGNTWILEYHSRNGYNFVKRSSYSKDLLKLTTVCDFLIENSKFKNKINNNR